MGKYDHLFFTIPPEYHSWEGYASPRAGFGGEAEMPGAKMYMGFSVSTKEGVMEVPPSTTASTNIWSSPGRIWRISSAPSTPRWRSGSGIIRISWKR